MATYAETLDYLYALRNRGAKLGVERMAAFNEALGQPDRQFPIIHVAGTNGKGSVCAMLEAIYRRQGLKTGLFTSPHLIRLGERVQVNRTPLNEDQIIAWTARLRTTAETLAMYNPEAHPTFFEFMTAMAFMHFAEEKIDVAIIETGLGGRLDSTNVITPRVSVITSVSYDHMEQLGDTLTKIASEKAGIIKPNVSVVLGHLPKQAETEIRRVAKDRHCGATSVREVFENNFDAYPTTNLIGDHQRINAATAMLAMCHAGADLAVPDAVAREALMDVSWAGRWQKITLRDGRTLILDAAHNPEGSEALDANLERLVEETGRKPVILCGTLGEPRAKALMAVTAKHASAIHLLVPDQPRACPHIILRAFLAGKFTGKVYDDSVDELFPAPSICEAGEADDILVATGSIYLLGEILTRLETTSGETDLQDKL
ncbi:bifunctional folylpolyglutamate synthase/dihydrofolate synthase [Cerasicoccus arenae]|uniref:Dihydrofolate synthase/folylpolyglutamate synthase n=1 Tax=Cerasicoccus arenae TaxID=424488 RepID=A0A8J3DBY4_9BACT|nr:folylpolyglutamate synthase/dihydrofolate synthase family protein [Cerasicoccus arenae]MBK1858424.1 bifunctional folylpolyglutamate synthase/dihydrofolate synthase [Cerasicoccus arenae]GHC02473.1 bifunctional folylpolyglutamate synthase/dihydrofolate synthase [Cerasicoccus arenae]